MCDPTQNYQLRTYQVTSMRCLNGSFQSLHKQKPFLLCSLSERLNELRRETKKPSQHDLDKLNEHFQLCVNELALAARKLIEKKTNINNTPYQKQLLELFQRYSDGVTNLGDKLMSSSAVKMLHNDSDQKVIVDMELSTSSTRHLTRNQRRQMIAAVRGVSNVQLLMESNGRQMIITKRKKTTTISIKNICIGCESEAGAKEHVLPDTIDMRVDKDEDCRPGKFS